jgi:hypothetical protein
MNEHLPKHKETSALCFSASRGVWNVVTRRKRGSMAR